MRIGQAGEFDYSGSQAIKALKEEGIATVLINPNIATNQTDAGMADTLYLQPLNFHTVKKIIAKEKPDGIFLSFGGQTALNLGLELSEKGVLKKYNVKVLGTPIIAIKITEDRELFKNSLTEIDVKIAKSIAVKSPDKAKEAAKKIGYPVMMRSAYALGGQGSAVIEKESELHTKVVEALNGSPQILIEEYLAGWKEIEYEVVRDSADNCITVCNMENFDPMGIHTGESIVVAPSQTLNNHEYHLLREIAIKTVRHIGIVGECNIQYALNPKNGDYRVIEINARLSRSSALASKATGYPLAAVAAKLALGKKLHEIKNAVTQKTSAFFEPALDYLVVKIPRWDIQKLKSAEKRIGTEMKSVGEVMAIGRSFPEALQKAVRMLNIGKIALQNYPGKIDDPADEIAYPTYRRLFAIYDALRNGMSVDTVHEMSKIDKWFLHHLKNITNMEKRIKTKKLNAELLLQAKKMGFSDVAIAHFKRKNPEEIRSLREKWKIKPSVKQIDTLAGEFPAQTNYLYLTYHGTENDIVPSLKKPIIVLGSGPYSIGSSVEFDWCAVNTAKTLRRLNKQTVIINSNPETVSTDYDESDRLYFEELTWERVRDIYEFEQASGIIISMGGQIPNTLSTSLAKAGFKIFGTQAASIDMAENREKFSTLLNDLKIDQPRWARARTFQVAKNFIEKVGYPVLVRPSYVLSGAAMNIVQSEDELEKYLSEATVISVDRPVVISEFITGAKELEIDGVAKNGAIVIQAISEHIENAGVHSGDATIVLPPQRLYLETIRRAKEITAKIVKSLNITGPFNIQFLAKENNLKVIECNIRASRSFPFVSKVTGYNFVEIATEAILNKHKSRDYETLELKHVGIKTPQFSYSRLKGSNPITSVEMASTGEVATLGANYLTAFVSSWLSTEQEIKKKKIILSIGGSSAKTKLLDSVKKLENQGWEIYATEGTHNFLSKAGIAASFLYKISDGLDPNVTGIIERKGVGLIINIPRNGVHNRKTDGFLLRRLAIDNHIPLITNYQIATILLRALSELDLNKIPIKSWQEYIK